MICASNRARRGLHRWMGKSSPSRSVFYFLSIPFFWSVNRGCDDVWWYVQLMPLSKVLTRMHAGEFKLNCALGGSYTARRHDTYLHISKSLSILWYATVT